MEEGIASILKQLLEGNDKSPGMGAVNNESL
jgi:hypothetical protein